MMYEGQESDHIQHRKIMAVIFGTLFIIAMFSLFMYVLEQKSEAQVSQTDVSANVNEDGSITYKVTISDSVSVSDEMSVSRIP